ncbi:diacylglycerol/lipid kinase family protein [Siansivirga zeaxanthinifaciens]|uniref:Lipid kinase n=1 Tax=Siansivirga zeaxanthinifaciens CC-SAMT-1 TaxID=1454006 RepID=A0A0C5WMD3_9FLAO|nr:diacylglycerol kinase family protein [Siansivirga zeaxanthinifaciens]AJR04045.1 lipid kinase [Siansivirga zeaxanthinifaciens CC-SAMT-1]
MKKIHFIINPVAGKGNNSLSYKHLKSFFNKEQYQIVIKQSTHKKHAVTLTQDSVNEQADVIVACGGDGTINEVASCIVGSNIILGIIPLGSGNGLASNLKIPKNINKALNLIKAQNTLLIDSGVINERYFFSNCGIGFDAQVIKNYESYKHHTLKSYIKAYFKTIFQKKELVDFEIEINDTILQVKPFMIFTSNSNELGYKISLTPQASLQDGILDIVIVSKIGKIKTLLVSILMLFKKHTLLKEVKQYESNKLVIHKNNKASIETQIDGEFYLLQNSQASISILNKSLRVIS